jgi:hypothetical protein
MLICQQLHHTDHEILWLFSMLLWYDLIGLCVLITRIQKCEVYLSLLLVLILIPGGGWLCDECLHFIHNVL